MQRRNFLNAISTSVLALVGGYNLSNYAKNNLWAAKYLIPTTHHIRHGLLLPPKEKQSVSIKVSNETFFASRDVFYGDGMDSTPLVLLTLTHPNYGTIQLFKDNNAIEIKADVPVHHLKNELIQLV